MFVLSNPTEISPVWPVQMFMWRASQLFLKMSNIFMQHCIKYSTTSKSSWLQDMDYKQAVNKMRPKCSWTPTTAYVTAASLLSIWIKRSRRLVEGNIVCANNWTALNKELKMQMENNTVLPSSQQPIFPPSHYFHGMVEDIRSIVRIKSQLIFDKQLRNLQN